MAQFFVRHRRLTLLILWGWVVGAFLAIAGLVFQAGLIQAVSLSYLVSGGPVIMCWLAILSDSPRARMRRKWFAMGMIVAVLGCLLLIITWNSAQGYFVDGIGLALAGNAVVLGLLKTTGVIVKREAAAGKNTQPASQSRL